MPINLEFEDRKKQNKGKGPVIIDLSKTPEGLAVLVTLERLNGGKKK